jgi:hypothetical protein
MKKIWKYFIMILVANSVKVSVCKAQITLDVQIDSSAFPALWRFVQISPTETKYFFTDTVNNTFSLYNMDLTPFIINVAVPNPWAWTTSGHYEAYYITRELFDCDTSNIEYVFAAPSSGTKPFRVIRTDGTVLFQRDSVIAIYCGGDCGNGGSGIITPIVNTSAGAKLVLAKFYANTESDFVYSLCGTVPDEVFDFSTMPHAYVKIFPNPTAGLLSFQINLPDNLNEYELVILSSDGRELKKEKINTLSHVFSVDVKNFSRGSYVYSLSTKSKSVQNGKFTINK